jgi:hypothetical protein
MDKNSKFYTFFSFGESKIARIVNETHESIIEEGNGRESEVNRLAIGKKKR